MYAQSIGIDSFWIGVTKTNGIWLKTNGEILSNYEIQLTNNSSAGDCMIADKDLNYKHKIVDCSLQFSVSYRFVCFTVYKMVTWKRLNMETTQHGIKLKINGNPSKVSSFFG